MVLTLAALANDFQSWTCGLGFAILCYSAVEGLGMAYDKIIHKTPVFWSPED